MDLKLQELVNRGRDIEFRTPGRRGCLIDGWDGGATHLGREGVKAVKVVKFLFIFEQMVLRMEDAW